MQKRLVVEVAWASKLLAVALLVFVLNINALQGLYDYCRPHMLTQALAKVQLCAPWCQCKCPYNPMHIQTGL